MITVQLWKKTGVTSLIALLAAGTIAACTNSARDSDSSQSQTPSPIDHTSGTVVLKDAQGITQGKATLLPIEDGKLKITVEVYGLKPGVHGMHIHEHGICTPNDDASKNFTSAGKHFDHADNESATETGDLAPITVNKDGKGESVQVTDAFTLEELSAGDGTSLIVHDVQHTPRAEHRLLCGVVAQQSAKSAK